MFSIARAQRQQETILVALAYLWMLNKWRKEKKNVRGNFIILWKNKFLPPALPILLEHLNNEK